jgi:micrococcal nuclease
MYIYKVKEVLKVVDGDTLYLVVDVGFSIYHRVELRLAEVNTWEIHGRAVKKQTEEENRKAEQATVLLTLVCEFGVERMVIKTVKDKKGKYGRYLAYLFFAEEDVKQAWKQVFGEDLPEAVLDKVRTPDGLVDYNKLLLLTDLAKEYK